MTGPRPGRCPDKATYEIQCPAGAWNGTLFLYSHGYVTPGSPNPAHDVGDPATGAWLLSHGFALAGSSYATTGWAIQQALPDQIATLDVFDRLRDPKRTIAWGHSLGGIITAGLIQDYPGRFSAALPMCGVLSGGVATWNTALDAAFAFQQLIDPSVQVVNITDPAAQPDRRRDRRGARSRPRRAGPGSPWPRRSATRRAGSPRCRRNRPRTTRRARRQTSTNGTPRWTSRSSSSSGPSFRPRRRNPSWNTGVNSSAPGQVRQLREVVALYKAAGLSLRGRPATLNDSTRISADPKAVANRLATSASTVSSRYRS